MGAFLRNALARDMRWRSPPDNFIPRSPTRVPYPSGRVVMKSCAFAALAAATTSSIAASGLAKRMFSVIVVENSTVSW